MLRKQLPGGGANYHPVIAFHISEFLCVLMQQCLELTGGKKKFGNFTRIFIFNCWHSMNTGPLICNVTNFPPC